MTTRIVLFIFVLLGVQYLAFGQNELSLGGTTVRLGESKSDVLATLGKDRLFFDVVSLDATKSLELCTVNASSMGSEDKTLGNIFFRRGRVEEIQRFVGNYRERSSVEFAKALATLLDNPATHKGKLVTIKTESTKSVLEQGMRMDDEIVSFVLSQKYLIWFTVGEHVDSDGGIYSVLNLWESVH